jgi:hypothetical protein
MAKPWIRIRGELGAESEHFLGKFSPVMSPTSVAHGVKALKILRYLSNHFGNIPTAPQIVAVNSFLEALHKSKGESTFKAEAKGLFGYMKGLRDKYLYTEPADQHTNLFKTLKINLRSISATEIQSKLETEAYRCGICRELFANNAGMEQNKTLPIEEGGDTSLPSLLEEERHEINLIVSDCLRSAKYSTCTCCVDVIPDERKILEELEPFAQDLTRACIGRRELTVDRHKIAVLSEEADVRCREPVETECGHVFGRLCLRPWVRQLGVNSTCPYCRASLSNLAPRTQTQ